jgi:hypothetical protein
MFVKEYAMEEQQNYSFPEAPRLPAFPAGKREFLFLLLILATSWLLCNSVFYAGLNLGFSIFAGCAILLSIGYLLWQGHKLTVYSGLLLGLSLVICGAFARSDDGFVKFIMFLFLILSSNLGLCLLAGQNRRKSSGVASLLDVPRTVFMLGLGRCTESFRGVRQGVQESGTLGRKGSAVGIGVLISIPLLVIVISLLIRADAAFDGLLQQLPDWNLAELIISVLFGTLLAGFFYSRGAALHHAPKNETPIRSRRGISPLTINTVLVMIGMVYVIYLVSQLAYFSGGFSGILPDGFTTAEYARRGFFEMAWLCAINLSIMALGVGLVAKERSVPLFTRLLCLFLGVVTLFLVASASAKMFLYIDSYGLTRLRLLTQVIIFFLGITTVVVSVWLFVPKMAYMRVVLVAALVIGAVVAWTDVDTAVARYNVNAYQSGRLEHIDVEYLGRLGSGAVPYIAQLMDGSDPVIAADARIALRNRDQTTWDDLRDWNYVNFTAEEYCSRFQKYLFGPNAESSE